MKINIFSLAFCALISTFDFQSTSFASDTFCSSEDSEEFNFNKVGSVFALERGGEGYEIDILRNDTWKALDERVQSQFGSSGKVAHLGKFIREYVDYKEKISKDQLIELKYATTNIVFLRENNENLTTTK